MCVRAVIVVVRWVKFAWVTVVERRCGIVRVGVGHGSCAGAVYRTCV